jgi:hypothetical protein
MGQKFKGPSSVTVVAGDSGTYSWDLSTNTIVAGANVARFFDLPFDLVKAGLPIERYIEKVHSDDRGTVARTIHDAIITGDPYQQDYRLVHADGTITRVMMLGQCFRNASGTPSQYVGMVFLMAETAADYPTDTLLILCQAAQEYAEKTNNEIVNRLLERAVLQLKQPQMDSELRSYSTKH